MSREIPAYLIDPVAKVVTQVTYTGGIQCIYDHIQARPFDVARLPNGDGIYVDDEGLFREKRDFFWVDGYPTPLVGRGLVLGLNREGESVAPHVPFEVFKGMVQFGSPLKLNGHLLWIPQGYPKVRARSLEGM